VNVTLPAFAAERRAAAPLLLCAGTCCMAPAARPQLSIDSPTVLSAANLPHAAATGTDTQ